MTEKKERLDMAKTLCAVCRDVCTSYYQHPILQNEKAKEIYAVSKPHMLDIMVGDYIIQNLEPDKEFKDRIQYNKNISIYRMVLADNARDEMLRFFNEQDIWYFRMKGQILRKYYPRPYYRQMCDYDFLYDGRTQKKVEKYMENRGFQHEESTRIDQSFMKDGIHFELHRALSTGTDDYKEMQDYYNLHLPEIIKNSKCVKGTAEREMSLDDIYIYMVVHAYKHYRYMSGMGIRHLIDVGVFLEKEGENLDYVYIERTLHHLRADIFEHRIRRLACNLFSPDGRWYSDTTDDEMLLELYDAGAYGKIENLHRYRIEKMKEHTDGKASVIRYIWDRIFPPKWQILQVYPWGGRSCFALLVAYMIRLSVALKKSHRFIREIKEVNSLIKENIEQSNV